MSAVWALMREWPDMAICLNPPPRPLFLSDFFTTCDRPEMGLTISWQENGGFRETGSDFALLIYIRFELGWR